MLYVDMVASHGIVRLVWGLFAVVVEAVSLDEGSCWEEPTEWNSSTDLAYISADTEVVLGHKRRANGIGQFVHFDSCASLGDEVKVEGHENTKRKGERA